MLFNALFFVRFFGEFTATAIFVGLGCMGCITMDDSPNTRLQSGLNSGLIIMVAMQCFGFVSGAHVNPCVSLCCCILGYIRASLTFFYVLAQFLGALAGFGVLTLLVPEKFLSGPGSGLCMTEPNAALSNGQALGIEFLLTSVLICGWCALWDIRNVRHLDSVALRVGLLVTCLVLSGGYFTGASMNPVRSFAPAFYHKKYEKLWIYFASQCTAALTTPMLWKYLFTPSLRVVITSNNDVA